MFRNLVPAAVAAVALGLAGAASAQTSANTTASGSLGVVQPISIAKVTDLSFGTVVRPASGNGTVTIDATTGGRTMTGGVSAIAGGPFTAVTRAAFTVSGEGGYNFSVTIPASFNITRNGNQDPIQVTLTSTTGTGTLSNSFGTTGTATVGVGGSVLLSNGTPSGAYTGTFTITVAYN
jgi:hypothetical protein